MAGSLELVVMPSWLYVAVLRCTGVGIGTRWTYCQRQRLREIWMDWVGEVFGLKFEVTLRPDICVVVQNGGM